MNFFKANNLTRWVHCLLRSPREVLPKLLVMILKPMVSPYHDFKEKINKKTSILFVQVRDRIPIAFHLNFVSIFLSHIFHLILKIFQTWFSRPDRRQGRVVQGQLNVAPPPYTLTQDTHSQVHLLPTSCTRTPLAVRYTSSLHPAPGHH